MLILFSTFYIISCSNASDKYIGQWQDGEDTLTITKVANDFEVSGFPEMFHLDNNEYLVCTFNKFIFDNNSKQLVLELGLKNGISKDIPKGITHWTKIK